MTPFNDTTKGTQEKPMRMTHRFYKPEIRSQKRREIEKAFQGKLDKKMETEVQAHMYFSRESQNFVDRKSVV